MDALKLDQHYSFEEYLAFERESDTKHEYHDGRIIAMAGGRPNHSQITNNTSRAVSAALDEMDCIVYGPDLKVRIEKANRVVYPDVMVVCGDLEMYDDKVDVITNPSLIVEVLSSSTERYDRTGKFQLYRQLPSFKEYVLIATDFPTVETFYREQENYWYIGSAIGLESSIYLKSIDRNIQPADIYNKVKDLGDPQRFLKFSS
ncbi:MAG: Uma2 family endonuclease [Bacteroidota bacterium]